MPALFDGSVNDISGVFYIAYFLPRRTDCIPSTGPVRGVPRAVRSRVEGALRRPPRGGGRRRALPATVKQLLTPDFCERVRHPPAAGAAAMRARTATATGSRRRRCGSTPPPATPTCPSATPGSCARDPRRTRDEGPGGRPGKAVDHFGAFKTQRPRLWLAPLGGAVLRRRTGGVSWAAGWAQYQPLACQKVQAPTGLP